MRASYAAVNKSNRALRPSIGKAAGAANIADLKFGRRIFEYVAG